MGNYTEEYSGVANLVKIELEKSLKAEKDGIHRFFSYERFTEAQDSSLLDVVIITESKCKVNRVKLQVSNYLSGVIKLDHVEFLESGFSKEEVSLVGTTVANITQSRVHIVDKVNNRIITFLPCSPKEAYDKYFEPSNRLLFDSIVNVGQLKSIRRTMSC